MQQGFISGLELNFRESRSKPMLDFMPHGACYLWEKNLILLHVLSDAGIALAYACLPLLLWYFVSRRQDIPFSWLFAMFGSFILSCGTTHVMAIWTLWHPDYLIEGLVKLITAGISLSTAIALFANLPQALELPSPEQMQQKERELQSALKQAQEVNQFRRRMISTVSHEYRTPLTAILSSTELLERYCERSPRVIRHFGVIKKKIAYLTQLLEDVLILDKSESGKLEFRPVILDAIAFCREILSELDWNDHIMELDATGAAIGLFDPRLLSTLLTNLVYNASKYSSAGTSISIRLGGKEGVFTLEVSDSGIGIPEADIPHIFESYYRASNVEEISGTGVGLAIVQKAVNLHGGVISVTSEVGVGTIFRVALPLVTELRDAR